MPRCAFVSFRLGGIDGVSIVAQTWANTLVELGWEITLVAGEIATATPVTGPDRAPVPVETVAIPGLVFDAPDPPTADELDTALAPADLVVVENLLTIPMNLPASRAVAQALRGRPAVLHHHDPAWQRARYAHIIDLPPTDPAWVHVTINRQTERELAARGIDAITVYNAFDTEAPPGDRDRTRAWLGVGDDEIVVAHPVRAIARKNLPAALALAESLGATYWLTGAVEEDYQPTFDALMAGARTRVLRRPAPRPADIYAAADLVVFPSEWEGFGNPPVEAAIWNCPVIVGNYPVAGEQRALGFDWPVFDWPSPALTEHARRWIECPDSAVLAHNHGVARRALGLDRLRQRLEYVLERAGLGT